VLSAVKQPEQGDGLIIRVYNPLPRPVEMRLELGLPFDSATLVNLREQPQEDTTTQNKVRFAPPGHLEMTLEAKRIQTILFR
jgi:alpha-mannosidase